MEVENLVGLSLQFTCTLTDKLAQKGLRAGVITHCGDSHQTPPEEKVIYLP